MTTWRVENDDGWFEVYKDGVEVASSSNSDRMADVLTDALNDANARIAELEAAQRQNWTPVSERLPDNWESVLTIDISKSTRGDIMTEVGAREKYVASLNQHLKFVHEAGEKLGVPTIQLYNHDLSKWSEHELPQYADWFYGNKSDPQAYDRAWLHHLHNNPHHWQYWVMPEQFNPDGESSNGCLEMPENYVLEMVADWMGANMAYQNTWDMSSWLKDNFCKIRLHHNSKIFLVKILSELGYTWLA